LKLTESLCRIGSFPVEKFQQVQRTTRNCMLIEVKNEQCLMDKVKTY
jgi:hypothetical protein